MLLSRYSVLKNAKHITMTSGEIMSKSEWEDRGREQAYSMFCMFISCGNVKAGGNYFYTCKDGEVTLVLVDKYGKQETWNAGKVDNVEYEAYRVAMGSLLGNFYKFNAA